MTWDTSTDDLRNLLSDGPNDRLQYRKRCIGDCNGVNVRFKTFEFRRVTDFTLIQGIWVSDVLQDINVVVSDDLNSGEFILNFTPTDADEVEATYYTQWFLDTELAGFLKTATNWLISSPDPTQVQAGLQPAALKYAAAEAYLKMAMRWRSYMSETYKTEDAPGKTGTSPTSEFIKMAETFRKEATKTRDEFFTRQGRSLQPLFGTVLGGVRKLP